PFLKSYYSYLNTDRNEWCQTCDALLSPKRPLVECLQTSHIIPASFRTYLQWLLLKDKRCQIPESNNYHPL
mgnify:CR=1